MKNYLFDPSELTAETERKIATLSKNRPDDEFVTFASSVIDSELQRNPLSYRAFGVYWWAVKSVLKQQGYHYGGNNEPDMADYYSGSSVEETLVAGDLFRDVVARQYIQGNQQWTISDNGEVYTLYDEDMEERG